MVAQDKSPIQCWRDLQEVYGNRALGKTRMRHWHKLFKLGGPDASTADGKHTGRTRSARTDENIQTIRDLLEDDRCKTIRELIIQSSLSQGTVHRIIQKDLKFSRICAKFVPRLLTQQQMNHRAELAADNLSLLEDGGCAFIDKIITGDETWLYCFNPQSKQHSSQWLPKGSKRPEKALRAKTASKKVMLTLFFDVHGLVMIHFLEQGETVDTDEYCRVLARLRENVRLKRPEKWRMNAEGYRDFLLHQDNATPHTSTISLAAVGENHMEMLAHPAYSPDMAPCDFAVFPALKDELKGHTFRNLDELKAEARKVLLNWPKDFFRRAMFDLPKRWAKCVAAGGAYFEGRGLDISPLPEFLDHSEDDWSEPDSDTDQD